MKIIKATKIKMKTGCYSSSDLIEIDSIFLVGAKEERFYKKASVHDYVAEHPDSIYVDGYPNTYLIPAVSKNGEKYVKSEANSTTLDNLLGLPRE